jgi:hypothetical protein
MSRSTLQRTLCTRQNDIRRSIAILIGILFGLISSIPVLLGVAWGSTQWFIYFFISLIGMTSYVLYVGLRCDVIEDIFRIFFVFIGFAMPLIITVAITLI